MIEIMIVILIVFAIILMILSYNESDPLFALLSGITWLIASLGCLSWERPYEIYNATSGNIETGTHVFENLYGISYWFMLFAIIMFLSFVYLAFVYSGFSEE